MPTSKESSINIRTVGRRSGHRQFVALWLGISAILAHAAAWGVIVVANFLADSMFAPLFIPFALLAIALVVVGLGLGIAAIVVALRTRPLANTGVVGVVLGAAGVVTAVLTFFTVAN